MENQRAMRRAVVLGMAVALLAGCHVERIPAPKVPSGWAGFQPEDFDFYAVMPKPVYQVDAPPVVDDTERNLTYRATEGKHVYVLIAMRFKEAKGANEAMTRDYDKGLQASLSGGDSEDLGADEVDVGQEFAIQHRYKTKTMRVTTLVIMKDNVGVQLIATWPVGEPESANTKAFLDSVRFK